MKEIQPTVPLTKKGSSVSYNYNLKSGYANLVVRLDGNVVSSSGTITMDKNHTINASSSRQYTLTVTKGTGVDGAPDTGTAIYDNGATVNYGYTLQNGYTNLVVTLDGATVFASGTVTMNSNHTLIANATSTKPSVTITSHSSGQTVFGKIYVVGFAQNAAMINRVELRIDDSLVAFSNSADFRCCGIPNLGKVGGIESMWLLIPVM